MEPTTFMDLAAEVEIPADGTLSRVLYKDDQIRMVVFAFDAGQELTEHTAAIPALIQVIRGRFRVNLGEQTIEEALPGFWSRLPAHLPHSIEALDPGVLLLTLLKG